MCGIAGILHLDGRPAQPRLVRRMAGALAHRGPDGEGVFTDGSVGLGHRRLAIIDLSPAGHQPMQSADGRHVLTYNGEIYNFNELRSELEALGRHFRSRSDSEVVLHALSQWGAGAIPRFNGMFAFAFWDRKERTLLLARDRYGIKPLYVTRVGGALLFASEIKAFLTYPGFDSRIDLEALVEYFTFQNFFTSRTLFRDVELLPSATWMQVQLDRPDSVERVRFWDYDFREEIPSRSQAEYAEELDYLLRQAVGRQLVGDVPVGAYLSGGMDSGAITAIAAPQMPDMTTFTVGFDRQSASGMELAFDERPKAEHMSYLFKTRHYEMVLKAGDMERCLKSLVWHLEEPRVGQSYPNFYASHLASRFTKVVLAGTGGDELFGGYPWRYYRAVSNDNFEDYVDKYYAYWQRLIPNRDIWQVFAPIKDQVGHVWTRDIFRDVFATHEECLTQPEGYVNHSLYLEARTFLHSLLVVEDKLSMAHGLETRVPFLDNDLVNFAQRLPVRFKLGNLTEVVELNENEPAKAAKYFERTQDGKLLLRQVVGRYVPAEISEGIKQGFSAPDEAWFKGDSIDYVRDRLLRPGAAIYDLLDRATTIRLVQDHLEGRVNRRLLIWSLLYMEEFLGQFMNRRAAE
jgi:asparagine synthase (glutamine-hydrolysing)